MKRAIISSALLVAAVTVLSGQVAWAQIPQTMSFQGVLSNAGGVIVSDGNYSLTFKLYDVATGGSVLWTETQTSVAVSNGVFNVILGSNTPLNLAFDEQYYLGVSVGSDPELSPRIQLASSPYSLNSASNGTASAWSLTGNSGINPTSNFLGTTDFQPLEFRVNNVRGLRLEQVAGFPPKSIFDGDVSIGLTTLERKLNVVGAIEAMNSAAGGIGVLGSGGSIGIHGRVSNATGIAGVFDNPFVGGIILSGKMNGIEKFRVDGSGSVFASGSVQMAGFRLPTGAASGYVLTSDVSGIGTWQPPAAGSIGGAGTTNFIPKFTGASALGNSAIFESGGNIGIGTTSPNAPLHINRVDGLGGRMIFSTNASFKSWGLVTSHAVNGDFQIRVSNNNGFDPLTAANSTAVMSFQENGNVGIGTTSPDGKLSIQSTSGASPVRYIELKTTNASDWSNMSIDWVQPSGPSVISRITTHNYSGGYGDLVFLTNDLIAGLRETVVFSGNGDVRALGNFFSNSSRRWKNNIEPIKGALDKVQRLRGVSYNWKESGKHDIGLIAEEVGEVIPEVVIFEENGKEAKGVDYARLVTVLIEAVKEQQKQIEELTAQVKSLAVEKQRVGDKIEGEMR